MRAEEGHPEVDAFFARERSWLAEMRALRAMVRLGPVTEQWKWGWPCYASQGKNIVLIHAFKSYCALLFFKGALLKDVDDVLVRQTENVQSVRQMRFTSLHEIDAQGPTIEAFVREAILVESAGLEAPKANVAQLPRPSEFEGRLAASPDFAAAFAALTPGRQRAYLLHFAAAKQSKTRAARVETCMPRVLAGRGLDD